MEVLQFVKTHLEIVGLSTSQSMQPCPWLNGNLFCAIFALSMNMILCCAYFFCVASSFEEYIDSFFTTSASTGILVIFSIFVWKMNKLFRYIDILQETVNSSKFWV